MSLIEAGELDEDAATHDAVPAITKVGSIHDILYTRYVHSFVVCMRVRVRLYARLWAFVCA